MSIQKEIEEQRAREALQAGDEVFITKGWPRPEAVTLCKVTRTTKTQIIIGKGQGESRYKKAGGDMIGPWAKWWLIPATDERRSERVNAERIHELEILIDTRHDEIRATVSDIIDVCGEQFVRASDFNEAEDVTANEQVLAKYQVALDELQAILARLKGEG